MKEILFIKTTSMGDVIHHMPAVTDAKRHFPDARICWAVDEHYAPLARLHPAVDEVFSIAVRRWRKRLFSGETWHEARSALRAMRARKFDCIIDTQGLATTGMIAKLLKGTRHGYDAASIREPFASRFYDVKHTVSQDLHAITRNRTLTALALGYEPQGKPDYGINRSSFKQIATRPYAMIFHATAQSKKEWPEDRWIEVAKFIVSRGLEAVLPWGSENERLRSERIAATVPGARVLERKPVIEVAHDIAAARLVVGVDTGFLHVAAAIGTPLVAVYIVEKSLKAEPVGAGRIELVGARQGSPDTRAVIEAIGRII